MTGSTNNLRARGWAACSTLTYRGFGVTLRIGAAFVSANQQAGISRRHRIRTSPRDGSTMKTPQPPQQTPVTSSLILASICVAVICGVGLVGCSSSSSSRGPKGVDRYVKAVQAYQSGNREGAVTNLVAATRTNPDLIMARVMLGDL